MIITRTPFRVSFFGGGTDYPEYFEEHGGAVLGTAIDASAYLSASYFPSRLFDYSIRISYRQTECVRSIEEIQHAPFRECMRLCGIDHDVELHYTADLPSFSGMGTSSSFVVGLLHALHAFQSRSVPPIQLAYQAIHVERNILQDCVGCQDQAFAAVGGFNVIEFRALDDIVVHRIPLSPARIKEFEQCLLVLYTGQKRRASEIASRQVRRIALNLGLLGQMRRLVDESYTALTGNNCTTEFGSLLDKSWKLKSQLDDCVADEQIHRMYQEGIAAGALGGKLLGAGGGGFMLFFVPPDKRQAVCDRLSGLQTVPVRINAAGSHLLHA